MYTSYYGLSSKPFQLHPDPRFFFGSKGHSRALAYLRYGLSQAEGFIVVTGGIGTGKTTLVRSLFKELDPGSVVAAQLVTTQLEADDLLRMLVAAFGLPHEDLSKAHLLKRLETFFRRCAEESKRVLLVVDEAQNLPARSLEELRMLSNFQTGETPLFQSFLLGQEEFRTTLQGPGMNQLRQRVIASCHLNPLSEQETRDYIEHRLHVAGWRDDPRIDDAAYSAIYEQTRGVPRRINILCDRLLLYGFLEELHGFGANHVAEVAEELALEVASPLAEEAEPVSAAPAAAPTVLDGEAEQRLAELEHTVSALLKQPLGRDNEMAGLEKRIARLEPIVSTLREGFTELSKRISNERRGR